MAGGTQHYSQVLRDMTGNKDSIFEPCTVMDYNPETMLAQVYGLNSKQYRENVPVLFPAMYLNSGIISPPAKESTGILFWGAENQPYLFPAYFLPPAYVSDGENAKLSASPKRVDDSFDLSNIEAGEQLIRSAGGAYIFMKNLGEVILGTSKLHHVSLSEVDGSFEVISERIRQDVGGYRSYNGPVMTGSTDHQLKIELDDSLPDWLGDVDDKDLVNDILSGKTGVVNEKQFAPLFELQAGNVYDGSVKAKSSVDGADLFFRSQLFKKNPLNEQLRTNVANFAFSKEGAASYTAENDRYKTEIVVKPGGVTMVFTDKQAADPADQVRTQTFGF